MLIDIFETLIVLGVQIGILAAVVYTVTKKAVAKAMQDELNKNNLKNR